MYNQHRGLGPAPGNARLNELLDGVRAEFDNQARAGGEYEHSSMSSYELQRSIAQSMRLLLGFNYPLELNTNILSQSPSR